jgi:hypothetical protein
MTRDALRTEQRRTVVSCPRRLSSHGGPTAYRKYRLLCGQFRPHVPFLSVPHTTPGLAQQYGCVRALIVAFPRSLERHCQAFPPHLAPKDCSPITSHKCRVHSDDPLQLNPPVNDEGRPVQDLPDTVAPPQLSLSRSVQTPSSQIANLLSNVQASSCFRH